MCFLIFPIQVGAVLKHLLRQLLSGNKIFQPTKVSVFIFLFHLIYTIDVLKIVDHVSKIAYA